MTGPRRPSASGRPAATAARRSDAGVVRIAARDITGLLLTGDMYGAPYDLLGAALQVRPDRVRAITSRWRRAGLAGTGRIGPGPGWCWLTPAGMRAAGLRYPARRPPLARLAHIRAVLATRITLQADEPFKLGSAWWRSERHLRCLQPGPASATSPTPKSTGPSGRQPLPRRMLGGRGRTDPERNLPHRDDHDRPAHPHCRLGTRCPARPGTAL